MKRLLFFIVVFFSYQVSGKFISFDVYEYDPIEIKPASIFELTGEGKFSELLRIELTKLITDNKSFVRENREFYKDPFKKTPHERADFYVSINQKLKVPYDDFTGMSHELTVRILNRDGVILQEKREILGLHKTDIKNGGTGIQFKYRQFAEEIVRDWIHGGRANSRFIRVDISGLIGRCEALDEAIERLSLKQNISINLRPNEWKERCSLDEADLRFLDVVEKYTKMKPRTLLSRVESLSETKTYSKEFKELFMSYYKK